jgi:hypothetical protein
MWGDVILRTVTPRDGPRRAAISTIQDRTTGQRIQGRDEKDARDAEQPCRLRRLGSLQGLFVNSHASVLRFSKPRAGS